MKKLFSAYDSRRSAASWSGDKKVHAVAVPEFELPLAIVISYKYSVEEIQLIGQTISRPQLLATRGGSM
jgi:hypothetical protein